MVKVDTADVRLDIQRLLDSGHISPGAHIALNRLLADYDNVITAVGVDEEIEE